MTLAGTKWGPLASYLQLLRLTDIVKAFFFFRVFLFGDGGGASLFQHVREDGPSDPASGRCRNQDEETAQARFSHPNETAAISPLIALRQRRIDSWLSPSLAQLQGWNAPSRRAGLA